MTFIKRSATILVVLLAILSQCVFSHTYLSAVYLDNTLLGEGDCMRAHPETAFDSPIPLVTQADMTCGWLPAASHPANRKCPISAGSKIGLQWHHNVNTPSDDIIDPSHKGPVIVYMAKSDSGAGSVWFKIYEDGYVNGAWGVDRLIANRGRVDFTIPSDIPSGNYLLRGEVIALHGAYALNGAQPYVGCVELQVAGTGSASPATVAFPGAYSPTDPGILLSIYYGFTGNYIIPGPEVYQVGSSPSSSGSSGSKPTVKPSAQPTVRPTSAPVPPTTRPTSAPVPPTAQPTTRPTNAPVQPTTRPTNAPVPPTTRPTNAPVPPTSAPSGSPLKIQLNDGSNLWWLAFVVTDGSETTVKAELMDSGSVNSFSILTLESYGFVFSASVELTLPITVRLTSASGKQVVLENIFSSITDDSVKNTGKDYSTSVTPAPPTYRPTTAPTSAPPTTRPTTKPTTPAVQPTAAATPRPTTKPTSAPTNPPSGTTYVKVSLHPGTTAWWLALAVSGIDDSNIVSVEIKDSDSYSTYSELVDSDWGYYIFTTNGEPLVAPFSVRVTSSSGKTATAIFNSFSGSVDISL